VASQFLDWAEVMGFPAIEISCGSVAMTRDVKDTLIDTAVKRFTVLTEIGRKDPTEPVSAAQWARDAAADLGAGARWVVTEGRESGTVGLFTAQGDIRRTVVDAVVASVGLDVVLFEAPQRAQQAWLIQHFGPNVNLGNISAGDALSVETLRLGLRSDTMDAPSVTGSPEPPSPPQGDPS
jgi:phosphosulfolactate synthase